MTPRGGPPAAGEAAPIAPLDAHQAKLRPPSPRPETVIRTALLQGALADVHVPLTVLSAPAGYGKTTVLGQWLARQQGRSAWLSLDDHDNDPAVLMLDAALALNRVDVVDDDTVDALRGRTFSVGAGLARLSGAVRDVDGVSVVIDNLEAIDTAPSLAVVGELLTRLTQTCRLAVATRGRLPVPTHLLRTTGDLVEIGVGDLAMDHAEAAALFAGAGVRLDDAEIERLVEQTEGWPVGLHLAALATRLGRPTGGPAVAFRGDHRLMGDYLRAEFFADLPTATTEFLTRTAVLDHLSGPLCDAVLDRRDAQRMLEFLEASNLLLVPLDGHREWYRYHRLFRELLAAELRRTEPELILDLHRRAGRWLEANRMLEAAIPHAQQAGDAEWVARLVAVVGQPAYASGRVATIRGWFEWFDEAQLGTAFAQITLLRAQFEILQGQPASAERWSIEAESGPSDGTTVDGSPVTAWRAYVHALAGRHGVAHMRADAREAQQTLAAGSPLHAGALVLEALALLLDGDPAAADPLLAHAAAVGEYLGGRTATVVALAERALLAIGRDDWAEARVLAPAALARVGEHRLEAYLEATPAFVAGARVAIHDGDRAAASELVARAARLRPLLTYALPATALFQLHLAHTYLALADPAGARTVLRELRDTLQQRRDLGIVAAEAEAVQSRIDATQATALGASSLTVAELRLLPYLVSHMTFQEIGEQLYVSRNTIKTQAVALYRKLGVSSRSRAVYRAREIGLLGG